jgi:hypothetical protein
MKIVITGHTNGIGGALYTELIKRGHEMVGYSVSNNCNISIPSTKEKILSQLKEVDVFINNVYSPGDQTELLEKAIAEWEGQKKLIVNLGSKSVYADVVPPHMQEYVEDKKKQNDIIEKRKLKAHPQIMNLILGLVDTTMSSTLEAKKLNPADLARLVSDAIELKDSIYIQNLTVDVPFQDWTEIRVKL